ncbi:hypothetical protein BS330_23710 [Amycolatopsis keratiniphila subsp. nogabecina]|uniref:Uncharacterized protein n=1 Tax=Amycolatopsis keratiniphila subsp. keratiniphila TaxID=227715 RepID=A0A1W2LKU3_9PSEU|nr:hypothetical protein BS330_23710 [Amycolatopsis keratiniphila subsp. nogabecina]ONF63494.1 hypothetical protein AVR91_0233680 [Amycolatopsis keratiniphila subsp. keratiniphila]
MPEPQHHEVREFGLPVFGRPQGEFVESVEAARRGEPEPHRLPGFVGLDVIPHRPMPAGRSHPERPVEPHRRPRVDGPEPVTVRGQRVDQRADAFLFHIDDPVMPVPYAHSRLPVLETFP